MTLQKARWIALLALPLSVMACAKGDGEGAAKEGAKAGETKTAEAKTGAFGRLTVEELNAKIADSKAGKLSLFIFDNNNKDRFAEGHIPGAKWVKFNDVKSEDLPSDKSATLVFYCANEQCSACHSGAEAALSLGYKNVYILPAGIQGWEKAQKPLEKA